jgi:hypothetical protein
VIVAIDSGAACVHIHVRVGGSAEHVIILGEQRTVDGIVGDHILVCPPLMAFRQQLVRVIDVSELGDGSRGISDHQLNRVLREVARES